MTALAMNGHAKQRPPTVAPGSLPPQNIEAELGVLSAALLDASTLDSVASLIRPEDFYRDSHAEIFRAMLGLREQGLSVDPISLTDSLRLAGKYEQVGGDDVIDQILATARNLPHAANAAHHAGIVLDKSISRRLVQLGDDLHRHAHSGLYSSEKMLGIAGQRLAEIESRVTLESSVANVPTLALDAIETIHARRDGHTLGVPTGLFDVDTLTNGLYPGWMYVLAARPAMGKTAWALQVADNVAASGRGVVFFSLEMTRSELGERLLVMHSEVGSDKVRSGARRLSQRDLVAIGNAYETLRTRDAFSIDDSATKTVTQISAYVRREKTRRDISLVVIDYVQLVSPGETDSKHESRQEQVAKISRGIKAMAKDNNVALIACAQLNRQSETREDHRPRLSDLRESGQLEADAHVVFALHRPEYYDPNDRPGLAELCVLKNRNGQTAIIPLVFRKHLMSFANFSPDIPAAAF